MKLIKCSSGTWSGLGMLLMLSLSGIYPSIQAQENQPLANPPLELFDLPLYPLISEPLHISFSQDLQRNRTGERYLQEISSLGNLAQSLQMGMGNPFNTGQFTITALAGPNGQISPSGAISVPATSNQSFSISPDPGYEIADVLVDGVSVGITSDFTFGFVLSDHSIEARFQAIGNPSQFTIGASAGANGQISPQGSVLVNAGESQSFSISPDAGFQIADVLVDGVSVGPAPTYTFSNVNADHRIEALFQAPPAPSFIIQASAGINGSISPSGNIRVSTGSSQAFNISPDPGYEIADVLVDGVSIGRVSDYTFGNVVSNHQIQASFRAVSSGLFTITT
ncbi:MAG: hypothetical protein AAFU64_14320, partial [Bacteroidota bacterium]